MIMTRIFFATDVHGSEKCWLKLVKAGKFYDADVVILGGDLTGKAVFSFVRQRDGKYKCEYMGEHLVLKNEEELLEYEKYVRILGYYPYRTDPEELEELSHSREKHEALFSRLMIETIKRWVTIADEGLRDTKTRILVAPGNDDELVIDSILEGSESLMNVEGKVVNVDGLHEMISSGWTNPTPWHTPREASEDELTKRIEAMTSRVKNMENCIFNFHAPPYGSGLDDAPALDNNLKPTMAGLSRAPVGSVAVLNAIEKYQPLLGLHGHIHESRGSQKIGRTLCLNPGSDYADGSLSGFLIDLDDKGIKFYQPTTG
jgi:hypothetical protein